MFPIEIIDEIILYTSLKEQVKWYFPNADINTNCIWEYAIKTDNLDLIKFLYKRKIYSLESIKSETNSLESNESENNNFILSPGNHQPTGHINLNRFNTGMYIHTFSISPGYHEPSGQINYETLPSDMRFERKIQDVIYKVIDLNNLRIYEYLFDKIISPDIRKLQEQHVSDIKLQKQHVSDIKLQKQHVSDIKLQKQHVSDKIRKLQEHACSKGAIDIVRFNLDYEYSIQVPWTITKPKKVIYHSYATEAAKNGHLDVIKLLHAYKYDMRYSPIIEAIRNNHLDVVRYLHQIIPKYPDIALEVAIKNSVKSHELKLLEYLLKTGIRANVNSLYCALSNIVCNDSNNEVAYFIYNNFEICRRKESINLCRRIYQPYKYQKIVDFFKNIRITTHPDIQNIIDEIMQFKIESQTNMCDCGGSCGDLDSSLFS